MTDVVMRQESSDNTLSVKELDVVLPRYQPFNGPLELYPTSHQQRSPYKPPLHHKHFDGKDFWSPMVKYLHPPDEDELERQMELDKKQLDAAAVLPPDNPAPVDGSMSPSFFDFLHPSQIVYRPLCPSYSPRSITYSPPTPGGYVFSPYERRNDALHAVPLPCSKKIGLHCYNLEKGTNFEPSGLPKVAEDTGVLTLEATDLARFCFCKFETKVWYGIENNDCFHVITSRCRTLPPPPPAEEEEKEECGFDTLSVDELFKGNMPDWLPDDTSKLLQYYEMKESEVEQAKECLHLYAELAWYTKKQTDLLMFEYSKPLELGKIIVQTRGVVDSMKDIKLLDHNAVFFISFKTSCGDVCKGIIRRTSDGKPEHLSLEAKCFM